MAKQSNENTLESIDQPSLEQTEEPTTSHNHNLHHADRDVLILPRDQEQVDALPHVIPPDYSEPAIYIQAHPSTGHRLTSNFGLGRYPVRSEVTDKLKEEIFEDFFRAQHTILARTPRLDARLCYLKELEKHVNNLKETQYKYNHDYNNQIEEKKLLERLTNEYEALFINGEYKILQQTAQNIQHPCFQQLENYSQALEIGFFTSVSVLSSTTCLRKYSKVLSCPYETLPFKPFLCERRWKKYVECCRRSHITDYHIGRMADLESELRIL
eukprot:gb/GECH01010274.1/.p1 GENE.gb/GECH01010274.1/~~gb/GECH01010274.1/.p1  ORF type:complete len:270 (+),score=55.57 gb/GECH01010274.1/:1-810(+)